MLLQYPETSYTTKLLKEKYNIYKQKDKNKFIEKADDLKRKIKMIKNYIKKSKEYVPHGLTDDEKHLKEVEKDIRENIEKRNSNKKPDCFGKFLSFDKKCKTCIHKIKCQIEDENKIKYAEEIRNVWY